MQVSFFVPASSLHDPQSPVRSPAPTISSVLALEALRGADLITGSHGMERPLQAAIALDPRRITDWLEGGELVISTLPTEQPTEWLQHLISHGAAGLILVDPREVPDSMRSLAETHRFPIITIAGKNLKSLIAGIGRLTDHLTPPPSQELSVRLTQLALDGAGMEAVAEALAAELHAPILVEDRQFNLVAQALPAGSQDAAFDGIVTSGGTPVAILKQLEDSGALRQLRAEKSLMTIPASEHQLEPRHILPVVVAGEITGYLSCLDPEGHAGSLAPEILQAGTHAVAIELLKQKGIAENEQKLRRDFFRDLLFSNGNISQETLHRRATYLGYQLSSAYWAMVVEFDQVPNEELLPDEVKKLANALNALLSFRQALVITQTQGATILYPLKEGQPTLDKIKHLAETIRQKISGATPGWTVSIGVGQLYADLLAIPRSYTEAQHAVKIGRALQGPASIACFTELGIYRMLLQFAQSQNPNEFFCEALQRLLEYDQQADKELVKTLSAFLECNGNLTETSDRLFIHRNTLKYRLERIRDITQIDLDDSENRLMLHLGLKMNQIVSTLRR